MRSFSDVLLYAQRRGWRPPAPIRRVARRLVDRRAADTPPVGDWATTLAGEPLGPPPEAPPTAAEPNARRILDEDAGPRLRCMLVTGVLDVGGSDEVVAFLARRLPEHGIETTVVHTGTSISEHSAQGGRLVAMLRDEGVEVIEATEASAAQLVADRCPDVISAHGAAAWWLDIATSEDVPWIETLHGMHAFFGADWAAERVRSRCVHRFIAVSELVRRQYLAGNPSVDPSRVVTVPNSVDDRRMPRIDRSQAREWLGVGEEFLFVSLARCSLQKNTYALVDAFADMAATHPQARLLVAGRPDDGPYSSQVRALHEASPNRDRIHLRDHAPWPAALLAAADGFVLDSYFEGWSLASMEALYAGLPVILSDVGGAREQVGEDGRRGHLVGNPVGDPLDVDWDSIRATLYTRQPNRDALVSAMRAMVDDRDRWAGRRATLREESAARFHPDLALAGHASVIRTAAAERVPS